jgi:hypothetical protein
LTSTIREFPLTDEIIQLLGGKIIRIYAKGMTLYVVNARSELIICSYTDELFTTMSGLKQALIATHEFEQKSIDKFLLRLSQEWVKSVDYSERKSYVVKARSELIACPLAAFGTGELFTEMSAIKTYYLIVRPNEEDEEKSMDENLVRLAEDRLNSENYSEYGSSYCPTCACPDQWSRDFLINHLKQHFATFTLKINGEYTHGYINQALRYMDECKRCSGTKIPVGPYHIMSENLNPRLQTELDQLHDTDRTNVLMQAVSELFEDINPELYRKYVSRELWFA